VTQLRDLPERLSSANGRIGYYDASGKWVHPDEFDALLQDSSAALTALLDVADAAQAVIRTRYDDHGYETALDELDHAIGHPYPEYVPRCWCAALNKATDVCSACGYTRYAGIHTDILDRKKLHEFAALNKEAK